MSKSHREKALDLIELSVDEGTSKEERLAAAWNAAKIIHKYDLLASPLDELLGSKNDAVRAASTVLDRIMDPEFVDSVKTIGAQFSRRSGGGGDSRRRRRRRR
jgi:hypothetical protein